MHQTTLWWFSAKLESFFTSKLRLGIHWLAASWVFSSSTMPLAETMGINFVVALTVHEILPLFAARSSKIVASSTLKWLLCSAELPEAKDNTPSLEWM